MCAFTEVERLRDTNADEDFDETWGLLHMTEIIADDILEEDDRTAIDPAVPAFVDLAAQWSATLDVPFKIVHDRSKAVESHQSYLEGFMSVSEPGRVIPNHGPSWRHPILASGISFVDSESTPQVQVADLFSGAVVTVLDAKALGEGDDFVSELAATRVGQLSYSRVWPTLAMTPTELHADERAGSASLDYMMEVSRASAERREHG